LQAQAQVLSALRPLNAAPPPLDASTEHWYAATLATSAGVSVYLAVFVGAVVVIGAPSGTPFR